VEVSFIKVIASRQIVLRAANRPREFYQIDDRRCKCDDVFLETEHGFLAHETMPYQQV